MALVQSEGRVTPAPGDSDWQKELMLLEEQYEKRGVAIRSEQLKVCSTVAMEAFYKMQRAMEEQSKKKLDTDRSDSEVPKTEGDAIQNLGLVMHNHGEDVVASPTKRRDTRDTPPRTMSPQTRVPVLQATEPSHTDLDQHQSPKAVKGSNSPEQVQNDRERPPASSDARLKHETCPESPPVKYEAGRHSSEKPQDQGTNSTEHGSRVSPDQQTQASPDQHIQAAPEEPLQNDEMQLDEELVLPSITTPEDSREWHFFAAAPNQTFETQGLGGHSTAQIRADYGDLTLLLNAPDSPLPLFDSDASPPMDELQPMFDPVRSCDIQTVDAYERKPDVVNPAELDQRLLAENASVRENPLYKAALKQDGLYHCPWEGKANCNHKPNKLKCHFDKFVDSHLKPYKCTVSTCPSGPFSSTACLLRHEREAHALHGHGDKPFLCPHEGCERALAGNGFPRRWNLLDHVRRIHKADGSMPRSRGRPAQQTRAKRRGSAAKGSSSELDELKADWEARLAAVKAIMGRLGRPEDPESVQLIKDAQGHLSAMSRLQLKISALK